MRLDEPVTCHASILLPVICKYALESDIGYCIMDVLMHGCNIL